MSLDREALTKDDKFFEDAVPGARTVVGSGQMIYWKQCTIKVFKSGEEKNAVETLSTCDGQALLKKGTSLLFEEGKVKEE